jgi:murein tripeptide amidase MpaA
MKSFIILSFLTLNAFAMELKTTAEKSGWKLTGRSSETETLCHNFQRSFPSQVTCKTYGVTPAGRNLKYLVVGNPSLPKVWVQAGIHAGEIDGKDAVFLLIRNILTGKESPEVLKKISLVFIPIVNLDGHERFGKWNRPNQVGPEEMGWRTTSQNFNMNRDFAKADSPEMQALLKLWNKMDPVLSLDLHVTDGAQFQPEVGLIIHPHTSFGTSTLHKEGKIFEEKMISSMVERGHSALPFYPSFEEEDRPLSGFGRYVSTTRFAHGYWYNNNRLGMLVETHSWKDYATRVKTHYSTVLSSLKIAALSADKWKMAEKELDTESLSGKDIPLEYKHSEKNSRIDFPGYKFTIKKSEISGEDVISYDPRRPEIWNVPLYEEIIPVLTVSAPKDGYYFRKADAAFVIPKLNIHGIKFNEIKLKKGDALTIFHAVKTEFSTASFESHQTLIVQGDWTQDNVKENGDYYFVPIKQPKARLVLQLFEPKAKDSFVAWGFFNNYFERKEYMEHYVTEEVAKDMLKNPEIKKEFEDKLKDKTFASNAEQRFEFFYRKHPSWDDQFNKYPVLKR